MIRRYALTLHLALGLADAATAATLFVAVSVVRFGPDAWLGTWEAAGIAGPLAAILYGLGWAFTLWLQGLYRLRARWSVRRELLDVLRSAVMLAVLVFAILFLFRLPDVSRLFLLALFPLQVSITVLLRVLIRFGFSLLRARGQNLRYTLIIGANESGVAFARRLAAHRDLGLRVVGYLTGPDDPPSVKGLPARVIGTLDDIEDVLHSRVVDEVAICLPASQWPLIESVAQLCEDEGKIVRIPLHGLGTILESGRVDELDGVPILSLVHGPDRALALAAKTALDVVGAAIGLVVLSPLLGVIALAVLVRDGRPILFRQQRVGLHGRPFGLLKFRTMGIDAEERLAELEAENEIAGPAFKLTNDPRVTRTGRWLRRTSLDELPQLLNVLRGEMSLVGPRPPLPREVAGYTIWHRRRLSMKPGITGLWQVSARREETFDRWVELDLDYIERWSFWLDLKILLRTIPAMLQGR